MLVVVALSCIPLSFRCFMFTKCHFLLYSDFQQSHSDLQNHCDDLIEELKVKNTQVTALNMKLTETEQYLKSEQKLTKELRSKNER